MATKPAKPVKKAKPSKATVRARHQAAVKAAKTRAANALHPHHPAHAKHHPQHPQKHGKQAGSGKPVKLARAGRPGAEWPLFGNELAEVCGPAAAATSLLLSTGLLASGGEVVNLYRSAALADGGVWLPELWEVLATAGLGGVTARARPLDSGEPYAAGDVLAFGDHAACWLGGGVILWGELRPFPGVPDGGWRLVWSCAALSGP